MAVEKNATPNGNRLEYYKLVCAVGETNHNKFWNVGLYDSGDVEIHFGRIGITESQGVHRGAGKALMEKKIKEKKKGKLNKKTQKREPYTEIDVIDAENGSTSISSNNSNGNLDKSQLKKLAVEEIEHSSPETAKLLKWAADINRHNISAATGGQIKFNNATGLFQTPLGLVTPKSVGEARNLLIDIADYVVNNDYNKAKFKTKVDRYLTLIPHNLGMRWTPETFLPDVSAIQKENSILDALGASYIQATTMDDGDEEKVETPQAKVFETKLKLVKDKSIIDKIWKRFTKTRNSVHRDVYGMKINKVWNVDVSAMTKAFDVVSEKVGNIRTLWHGTQAANLLSILKVGLIIPPSSSSHCTGRMFGDGLYASDQSTKALNYATSFWGGKDVGRYFMFLVKFAMGKEYYPSGYGSRQPDLKKYDSTFAKAGSGGVRNNEMIVYRTNQAKLVHLVEFRK